MATLTISITAPHVSDSFEFEATEANIRNNMEAVEKSADNRRSRPGVFAHGKAELTSRRARRATELSRRRHDDVLLYFVLAQG